MRALTAAALALVLCGGCVPRTGDPAAAELEPAFARAPSVLVIITDDQRWDTVRAMPRVQARLADHGVTFTDAYVTNPSCCPSRTSLLTGRSSHSTGVWSNTGDHGGFAAFDDGSTLATWLDEAGYRTGLFGKYLNGYEPSSRYVPPGWDAWLAGAGEYYYDYSLLDARGSEGRIVTHGADPSDYSTRVLTRRTRAFITSTAEDVPFFAVVAYHAPHPPGTPDPRDVDATTTRAGRHPPSFDERNVSDKPDYIRALSALGEAGELAVDAFRRDQLRSLLAVDRGVDRLLSTLGETGRLRDTMVVFTSDNGYQWGEHRWVGKGVPYEESIRVPLVVRFDPLVADPGGRSHRFVLGIDLAPTVAEITGISPAPVDGTSFAPLLLDPAASFRASFVVEHRAEDLRRPSFCALRRGRWSFVRYYVDAVVTETELYDLAGDPFQLRNRADAASYADARAVLEPEADTLCVPPPA